MTTVRAQNLQDLIYKRGQAGVTKASVTIVFDNRDTAKSPIGFEEYATISVTRQIVLGGTSKYLINGHRAQQQTVQNLFQSVQLNINNPNFLIMQGRITKVLNMKAVEILSMIEEAAGTRMFEDRREKAAKTMSKKDLKLREIEGLLKEEIEPKLEKLRAEKRAFLDFQQTQNDLERLTRLVVAHDYIRGNERLRIAGEECDDKREKVQTLEENGFKLKNEIAHLEEDVKRVRTARDKELRKGGKFQGLEDDVKANSHELVRLTTVFDLKNASIAEEQVKLKDSQKTVKDLEKVLKEKKQVYDNLQAQYDAAKAELDTQTAEVEQKEELLQSLQTGVASKEGQESGYQGQLQDSRNRASGAATEQEQAKLKIAHLEKRVKEEEPRAKKAKQQNSGLLQELEGLKSQAKKLESELTKLGYEPGKEEQIYQEQTGLQKDIRELRGRADDLKRKVANIDFNYADPHPNFDRSKVKGLVASLFTLNKDKIPAATALEICAGGRLYNVVVDSAETGTQLLQKGKLRKRVTIIPLNKIAAFRASVEKIGAAQNIAPGKVDLALSLIGYDEEIMSAMNYVFGNTLVCHDADTASYGLDHVLQRRLLLLDAVDHVHDLGVDLLLHSLEPFGNVAQRRFAFCNVLALEIVDCVRTPEVVLLVRNPFVLGFHMANRLSGNVLILFQFLKLMPELLHIQTVLGNPRVLGLHRLLKLPQLLVKASQFGPFVIELRLRNIMCILFPER